MFISRTTGGVTSTIRIYPARDLLVAFCYGFIGLGLVVNAIAHPMDHYQALVLGSLAMFIAWALAMATIRNIRRAWETYNG